LLNWGAWRPMPCPASDDAHVDPLIKRQADLALLARAGFEKAESGGDSQAGRIMIHPAGWKEASLDGKTLFAGFADVRCQRELCDQAHAAG